MDFKKIFNRKNLPFIGLFITITIVVIVAIRYKNKKDCEAKKLPLQSILVALSAQATEIEININQKMLENDPTVEGEKEILGNLQDEIKYRQQIIDNIKC